jgi:hypothetical protein
MKRLGLGGVLAVALLRATAVGAQEKPAFRAGETYYSEKKYIEYQPGTLPILIVAPHGGELKPEGLPDLSKLHGRDNKSQEYARETAAELERLTKGGRPHLVINLLHADKLNAARSQDEAAGQDAEARKAWEEFHGFIDAARREVSRTWKKGHYFEFHTNGHAEQWIEVGLGVKGDLLNAEKLDAKNAAERSTIRTLASQPGEDFLELLRGPTSLGGLLEARGYRAVPSPKNPGPGTGGYFYAGWNTWRHGSRDGGAIDATHLETHFSYLIKAEVRKKYVADLAESIQTFVEKHYAVKLADWAKVSETNPK